MATSYTLDTEGQVTPEDKGGPRVGIGCRAYVTRPTDGPVGISILRGDGEAPTFSYTVRTLWTTLEAGTATLVTIAALDLPAFLSDFTARNYRMQIATSDGEDITVTDAMITTEPYTAPGLG